MTNYALIEGRYSYPGAYAQNIHIDELEIEGTVFPCELVASFEWLGDEWVADECYLRAFDRVVDGDTHRFEEHLVPILENKKFVGLVEAAEAWANKRLMPWEYM